LDDLTIIACKDLICRLLYLEIYRARRGDSDAMHYLLSLDAEDWAILVGMDRKGWAVRIVEVMWQWEGTRG